VQRERALASQRALADLRARVEELVASRETVLTRVAEWQRSLEAGDDDALDLAEFISALRRDILELEHRNVLSERREAELRARWEAAASLEPPAPSLPAEPVPVSAASAPSAPPALLPIPDAALVPGKGPIEDLVATITAAESPERQASLLGLLGRSGHLEAVEAIRPWALAAEPLVRAAAYEALGRLLERDPARLEPHVRWGLADGDARVRRRVALAAATARGLALRPLLEPLLADPDPQVRRVTREILRRAPLVASDDRERPRAEVDPVFTEATAGVSP
jgi:hypothetical protein